MASDHIHPLRISKGSGQMSPSKMNRTLAELSPMGIRRNSPSFPQGGKNRPGADSSPLESASSPRMFWQGRDPASPGRSSMENRNPLDDHSPIPSKRSSIENLKKASRVKNSSMYAREQKSETDPSQLNIPDRPLANGKPLARQVQANAFGAQGAEGARKEESYQVVHETIERSTIETKEIFISEMGVAPLSPSKHNVSPTKSSLSKRTGRSFREMGLDPESSIWSEEEESVTERKLPEGRSLHRRGKSVTFDQAPPQVNEYEMTTPDPSSVASGSREGSYESMEDEEDVSFERGSSMDREDSFDASLEDTDKTPVVLPEDWRFMSPDTVNTDLIRHEDDAFDGEYGSPEPTAGPGLMDSRPHQTSVNSVDSNGQSRPLPPLPNPTLAGPGSPLSGTLERISSGPRSLPSPPLAAGISKSDIRRMSGSGLSLEDRLRLMMIQEQDKEKTAAEAQRERRMRRADAKDLSPAPSQPHQSVEPEEFQGRADHAEPASQETHFSRDSILRKLASQQDLHDDTFDESAMSFSSNLGSYLHTDRDTAIPSMEDPTQSRVLIEDEVFIKAEPTDESNLDAIPSASHDHTQEDFDDTDSESQYSQASAVPVHHLKHDDGQETPRAQSPAQQREAKETTKFSDRASLPLLSDFASSDSFDLGLESYMTTSRPIEQPMETTQHPQLPRQLQEYIARPQTPELQLAPPSLPEFAHDVEEPGTPDSVIRHPRRTASPEATERDDSIDSFETELNAPPRLSYDDGPDIAANKQQVRTSKDQMQLPGDLGETSKDMHQDKLGEKSAPKEQGKRVSSLVQLDIPRDRSDESLGFGLEKEFDRVVEAQKVAFELSLSHLHHSSHGRVQSTEQMASPAVSRKIDIPLVRPQAGRSLDQGYKDEEDTRKSLLNHTANRTLQRQRGYLMRQNTKVVVASNRAEDDSKAAPIPAATSSPLVQRKVSQQTWVTEPWNGKSRRRSIRATGDVSPRKKVLAPPVPPLPGQSSAVQETLDAVHEDEIAEEEEGADFDENAERGRLFVKVVGVKDLDLPLSRDEQSTFALTLDNGLHCVTTSWLPLGRHAQIGQEFELVVLNELEFQLTLQMKLEEPIQQRPESPTKTPPSPVKKQGAFSRFFGSPRKNKDAPTSRPTSPIKPQPPSTYDLVQGIVGQDGSFARAYVALSEHEKHAFGRPYTADITCFNEWAVEEVAVGSSRSKKGVVAKQSRPPYQIGKLELQLLYIPKPKGAKDEDMPKSMNSAVRELREAASRSSGAFEGHLSQQGGDCPYWRRRLFKLAGSKLTAYHETTHQPRATINLAKASKLIDDKSSLTRKETSTKGGGRRKSAFAEEEEGYMFVEEGFRIRFGNGEVIDFYADSPAEKGDWMKALAEVVGKPGSTTVRKPWVDTILKRERSMAAKEGRVSRPVSPVKPETSPIKWDLGAGKPSQELPQEKIANRAAPVKQQEHSSVAQEEARRTIPAALAPAQPPPPPPTAEKPLAVKPGLSPKKRSSIPLLSSEKQPSPEKAALRHSHGAALTPAIQMSPDKSPTRHSQGAARQLGTGASPVRGHARTESAAPATSARSQPSSPIKDLKVRGMMREGRQQKARSMLWH